MEHISTSIERTKQMTKTTKTTTTTKETLEDCKVFKIQGLNDLISGDNNNLLKERMKLIDLTREVVRSVIIDSEDTQ